MSAGSMVLGARRELGAPSAPFTLEIFGGKARVGLSGLSAGPVRVDLIELDVFGFESHVVAGLDTLKRELPDRRSGLVRLRASAGDRHLDRLVEGDLRISVLPGRLFVHGRLPAGGRLVMELVEEPSDESEVVSLQVATVLRVGIGQGVSSAAREALPVPLRAAAHEGRLRLPAIKWICAHALAPLGWRLPLVSGGTESHLVLWEGQVLLEVSEAGKPPTVDVDATTPDSTIVRSVERRRARAVLAEAEHAAAAGDRNGAIRLVQRQLAAGTADVPALCTCATAYLPAEAVAFWCAEAPDSFSVDEVTILPRPPTASCAAPSKATPRVLVVMRGQPRMRGLPLRGWPIRTRSPSSLWSSCVRPSRPSPAACRRVRSCRPRPSTW